jgi:hypothetical protein
MRVSGGRADCSCSYYWNTLDGFWFRANARPERPEPLVSECKQKSPSWQPLQADGWAVFYDTSKTTFSSSILARTRKGDLPRVV